MRLFWLGLAWLAGIALGRQADLPGWYYLIGAALGAAAARTADSESAGSARRAETPDQVGSNRRTRESPRLTLRALGPFVMLASLGALRLSLAAPPMDSSHVAHYNDLHQPVELEGVVADYPDVRERYVGLRLQVELLQRAGSAAAQPATGLILVQADRYGSYRYGDRLRVTGYLETPPDREDFSYRNHLARQGILSMMSSAAVIRLAERQANPWMHAIFVLRERSYQTIYSLFPDPEAGLLAGILLGLETGISPSLREDFNATGTTHIIAISGFNLTILAAVVIRLFGRWLGIRRGAAAAGATIFLYTLLVGADAAVVRAAIMGGLALFARFLGRQAHGLASLSTAAAAMTAIHPLVLWDVGFQLSFAATLGLLLYADPIQRGFVGLATRWMPTRRAKRLAAPVGEYLLFTLAAQATTLPLTMAYFQRLSLSSLVANPLILPAQPPLMILGGLATIAGLLLPPLGKLLALVAWPFPAFTIRAVSLIADWPRAWLPLGSVAPLTVLLLYAVLFGATWLFSLPAEQRPRLPRPSAAALVLGLAVVTGITWRELATRPDGKTHITIFASSSRLIESPFGRFVLIGGGESSVQLSQQLGLRLPLLHRQIDWLVIADTREPHVAGLVDLSDRYRIQGVLIPGHSGGTAFRSVLADLQASGAEIVQAEPGHALRLGPQTQLVVLERDELRLSLLLVDGWTRVALLADSEPLGTAQAAVPAEPTALVVHRPTSDGWLSTLRPWLPIATGSVRSAEDWPLRTEHHGWIELVSDGRQLWVQSEHPADLSLDNSPAR